LATKGVFYVAEKTCTIPRMRDHLHDLYPGLSASQAQEARDNLARYVEVAFDIAMQDASFAGNVIDNPLPSSTMEERSNSNLKNPS
jgi:hypothetical protein